MYQKAHAAIRADPKVKKRRTAAKFRLEVAAAKEAFVA
jgi:hypothetical protein